MEVRDVDKKVGQSSFEPFPWRVHSTPHLKLKFTFWKLRKEEGMYEKN